MLEDKMRSSYIISAVAPDKTVQCFDSRLFTITVSQCCISLCRTECSRAATDGNIISRAVFVLVAIRKKWVLEVMMRAIALELRNNWGGSCRSSSSFNLDCHRFCCPA